MHVNLGAVTVLDIVENPTETNHDDIVVTTSGNYTIAYYVDHDLEWFDIYIEFDPTEGTRLNIVNFFSEPNAEIEFTLVGYIEDSDGNVVYEDSGLITILPQVN